MNNTTGMSIKNATTPKNTAARAVGAISAGFIGLFAVPILSVLIASFAAIGIGLPILSVLNLIGLTQVPFNVLLWQISGFQQVFVAVVAGVVFIGLSLLCVLGLKKYFAFSRRLTR